MWENHIKILKIYKSTNIAIHIYIYAIKKKKQLIKYVYI